MPPGATDIALHLELRKEMMVATIHNSMYPHFHTIVRKRLSVNGPDCNIPNRMLDGLVALSIVHRSMDPDGASRPIDPASQVIRVAD